MATILHTEAKSALGLQKSLSPRKTPLNLAGSASIIVSKSRERIDKPHGISHGERDVLAESLDYMHSYGPAVLVSIEAGRTADTENIVRSLTRDTRSFISLLQSRTQMRRRIAVTVFHALARDGLPKFNSHIVAPFPTADARDRTIESLNRSSLYLRFPGLGPNAIDVKAVDDWMNLPGYLLREITQQGAWNKPIYRAYIGSIPLGARGGNRVIPSGDLYNILIKKGRIPAYQKRYARRLTAKQIMFRDSLFEALPMMSAPPKASAPSRHRNNIAPAPMQRLLIVIENVDVIETMRGLGPTQKAIAAQLRISRQHVTNILNYKFGASRAVVRRVLELARAA